VIKAIESALIKIKKVRGKVKILSLSPSGKMFENRTAEQFKKYDHIIIICGRYEGIDHRVNKIFNQISPYLKGVKGKVFDYGMGAGEVTQTLKNKLALDIEGGDVRDFRSKEVTVPFVMLNDSPDTNGKIVNVADKYYEVGVLTNVIHHEKVNENILKELDRIVAKKLVIIETVPVGNTPEEIARDHERTFANDTLWNRFFNYADIPVPGTYKTPEDWIKRFESYGWKTTHSEDLGYDQKSIHDVHHLLVFER
jgi:SAM-dependent methyltransferase